MILEISLSIIIGIILGIITGLTPGIHINLVATILLALSVKLSEKIPVYYIGISILAMSITHVFLDSIPSIFLGAPDTDQILTTLPGHRMLLKGSGYQAVAIISLGALLATILAFIFSPLTITFIKATFNFIKPYIGFVLILASVALIIKESNSKFWAFIMFCLSGVLGLAAFNIDKLNEPLFPMLSGLFGISTLILSISQKISIPHQCRVFPKIRFSEILKLTPLAAFSSSLFSFLPGLGSTQATILASSVTRRLTTENFLFLNGGINAVNMFTSLLSLYAIGKARNGSIVVMSKIVELTKDKLTIFLIISVIVSIAAFFLSLLLASAFTKIIPKINYKWLCISIIVFVTSLAFYFSGFIGIFVLITSTLLGLVPTLKNIGKNHLMGCLLLPIILYFLL